VAGEQRMTQLVPGQYVRAPAEDQRRDALERPHQVERLTGDLLRARTAHPRRSPGGTGQSFEMVALVGIEPEGPGDRVEHLR
jgi:hypothetical protein